MAGGDKEAFLRAEPYFRAMGTTITHVGEAGAGQTVKLCNQLVCAINLQAICEALALGRASGVDLDQLRNVLLIVLLLRGIWMFTKFDVPWLLGFGGGAGEAIRTLPVFTYQRSFTYYQAGMGAALSNVMLALLLMAVTIYFVAFPPSEDATDA